MTEWTAIPWTATPWTPAHQASLSFTISLSLLKLKCIELVMSSNHLIICHSLLLLPSTFPSIRVFSNEWAPHIKLPKYWTMRNPGTPYRLEMRADSLSLNEKVRHLSQAPQDEFSLRNMYVRGTLCFMLQAKWTPRCPD